MFYYQKKLGTSKAFNFCAKKTNSKYVLWINSDILIKENFIKKLYDFMEIHKNVGICGGNLLDFDGNPRGSLSKKPNSFKAIRRNNNKFFKLLKKIFFIKDKYYNFSNKPMEVSEINGADMFVRSSVFDKIGYLDEDIFMYGEETEFEYRVKKKGWEIFSVPSAHMYHLEGASFYKRSLVRIVKDFIMKAHLCTYGNALGKKSN